MAVSKRKIGRFVAVQEALKEVATDNDLNVELSDSPFLKTIGFKFIFALSKRNINTVRDLVFSDVEEIVMAVNGSETATVKMTSALRKLYLSYGNAPQIKKNNKVFIPDVTVVKTFSILRKMNREQLAVYIGLDNIDNVRLCNALQKANILTFQDLKDAGIEKIQNLPSLGRKTFVELYNIVESFYLSEDGDIDDIVNQFRNHLMNASKEVKDDFNVKSLEEKLYGYIAEYVDMLELGRNGEIYKLRTSPEKITLEKIGNKYGFTRERVRQIVAKVNNKVVAGFTNRKKASTVDPITNFYKELISIDKDKVLYPLYEFIQKKNTITEILYPHFKAIGLLASQIVIIRPEPVEEVRPRKPRKTKVVPDTYMTNGILSVVQANNGKWRIGKVVNLLYGDFDFVFEKEYQANKEFFAWGKNYTKTYITESIYYLINNGLIHEMKDGSYKLYVTNKGRSLLELLAQHKIEDK